MKLIELNNTPILEQLHLEEALVRTCTDDYLIINQGSPPAIVMGISGKPDELVHLDKLNIPLIKRYSGGGTVVVDEKTIFLSIIANRESPFPERIMRWAASLLPHPITLQENDYCIGPHKCGGNAQYIRKNRFVHHTTFLWDYDPERMSLLKQPKRQPKYRSNRPHTDFICRLKDHFSTKESFIAALKKPFLLHPHTPSPPQAGHRIASTRLL